MEVKYLKLWNQDEKDFQENAIRNEGIRFYYYIILGYAFSFICYFSVIIFFFDFVVTIIQFITLKKMLRRI